MNEWICFSHHLPKCLHTPSLSYKLEVLRFLNWVQTRKLLFLPFGERHVSAGTRVRHGTGNASGPVHPTGLQDMCWLSLAPHSCNLCGQPWFIFHLWPCLSNALVSGHCKFQEKVCCHNQLSAQKWKPCYESLTSHSRHTWIRLGSLQGWRWEVQGQYSRNFSSWWPAQFGVLTPQSTGNIPLLGLFYLLIDLAWQILLFFLIFEIMKLNYKRSFREMLQGRQLLQSLFVALFLVSNQFCSFWIITVIVLACEWPHVRQAFFPLPSSTWISTFNRYKYSDNLQWWSSLYLSLPVVGSL